MESVSVRRIRKWFSRIGTVKRPWVRLGFMFGIYFALSSRLLFRVGSRTRAISRAGFGVLGIFIGICGAFRVENVVRIVYDEPLRKEMERDGCFESWCWKSKRRSRERW